MKRPWRIGRTQLIETYDIRTPSADVPAATLSGGNQQKTVVAREFSRDIRVLILDQPTRGLDVGSIEFIHRQIVAKRDEGVAVLLVSAELDEIMELSDHIAVMYRGEIVATVDGRTADREDVGLLMATGRRDAVAGCHQDGGGASAWLTTSAPRPADASRVIRTAAFLRRVRRASLIPALAVLLGLLAGAIVIIVANALAGEGWNLLLPIEAYASMLEGALG